MKHLPALPIRVLPFLFFLVATASAGDSEKMPPPRAHACPTNASLSKLSDLGNIYLGEVHGTNQSPRLLVCLVDFEVADDLHPLTVSLELQPWARDTSVMGWSGQDGRTSKAMAALVDHLLRLEKVGKIVLNFQLANVPIGSQVDEKIGSDLQKLASKGRVIALGGNFHAQRQNLMLPGITTRPAGSYVGARIKNVLIDATGPGEASECGQEGCGITKVKPFLANGKIGTLESGEKFGYDFVYFVAPFTASAPKFKKKPHPGH